MKWQGDDDELGDGGDELDVCFEALIVSLVLTASPSTRQDDGESKSMACFASKCALIDVMSGQIYVHNLQCFSVDVEPICSFWK